MAKSNPTLLGSPFFTLWLHKWIRYNRLNESEYVISSYTDRVNFTYTSGRSVGFSVLDFKELFHLCVYFSLSGHSINFYRLV